MKKNKVLTKFFFHLNTMEKSKEKNIKGIVLSIIFENVLRAYSKFYQLSH